MPSEANLKQPHGYDPRQVSASKRGNTPQNFEGDFDSILDEALNPRKQKKRESVASGRSANSQRYKMNMIQLQAQQQNANSRSSIHEQILDNGGGTIARGNRNSVKSSMDDGLHQLIQMAKLKRQESRLSSKNQTPSQIQHHQSNISQQYHTQINNSFHFQPPNGVSSSMQHYNNHREESNTLPVLGKSAFQRQNSQRKSNLEKHNFGGKTQIQQVNNYEDDETPWTHRVSGLHHHVSANSSPQNRKQLKFTGDSTSKLDKQRQPALQTIQLTTTQITPNPSYMSFDNTNSFARDTSNNQIIALNNNIQKVKIRDSGSMKRGSFQVKNATHSLFKNQGANDSQLNVVENDVPAQGQGGVHTVRKSRLQNKTADLNPQGNGLVTGQFNQSRQDSSNQSQEEKVQDSQSNAASRLPIKKFKNESEHTATGLSPHNRPSLIVAQLNQYKETPTANFARQRIEDQKSQNSFQSSKQELKQDRKESLYNHPTLPALSGPSNSTQLALGGTSKLVQAITNKNSPAGASRRKLQNGSETRQIVIGESSTPNDNSLLKPVGRKSHAPMIKRQNSNNVHSSRRGISPSPLDPKGEAADDLANQQQQAPNSALLSPNKKKKLVRQATDSKKSHHHRDRGEKSAEKERDKSASKSKNRELERQNSRSGHRRGSSSVVRQQIVIVQQPGQEIQVKKNVHFKDEVEGNSLCDVVVIESYKKYYNDGRSATCSCTCSIF